MTIIIIFIFFNKQLKNLSFPPISFKSNKVKNICLTYNLIWIIHNSYTSYWKMKTFDTIILLKIKAREIGARVLSSMEDKNPKLPTNINLNEEVTMWLCEVSEQDFYYRTRLDRIRQVDDFSFDIYNRTRWRQVTQRGVTMRWLLLQSEETIPTS